MSDTTDNTTVTESDTASSVTSSSDGATENESLVGKSEVEKLETDEGEKKEEPKKCKKKWFCETSIFVGFVIVFELIMVLAYSFLVENGGTGGLEDDGFEMYYKVFIDVSIMIFVGFGLLMSFYKKYGYFAMGMVFFVSAFVAQFSIFLIAYSEHLVEFVMHEDVTAFKWIITLNLPLMIKSLFAAGAVMISFGVIIGKATPFQLILLALLEIPFYVLNVTVCEQLLQVSDVGGSMLVHAFGAYFGIFASLTMTKSFIRKETSPLEGASYVGDILSLLGTVFLWILWPSFNGALEETYRHRVVINTFVSLVGCCITAFAVSRMLRKKFCLEDLQNATIAGGVAIGSSANLSQVPGITLLIGILAGAISVVGYKFVKPLLSKFLHDSCGVNNLHGMPALLGGFASALTILGHENVWQPLIQAGCVIISFALSAVSGAITGVILRFVTPAKKDALWNDAAYFEMDEEECECKKKD